MNHAEVFAKYQAYLFALARRILGSPMDAEDLLQETFIRWLQASFEEIKSPKAFLTTVLTNLCLNHLQSARVKREKPVDEHLSELCEAENCYNPSGKESLTDSLSIALMLLLERLSPKERAVFLLREVFDYEYEEIAEIVKKNVTNCRQMLRRARQHITSNHSRFVASQEQLEKLLKQFSKTCANGNLDDLVSLLI